MNLALSRTDFVAATQAEYHMPTRRVPNSLTRVKSFRDGDLLVTPHLPGHGQVSIHVVNGEYPDCYKYVPDDGEHLNHRIRVRASYGLEGNISMRYLVLGPWYAKVSAWRLPIVKIPRFNSLFTRLQQQLSAAPEDSLAPSTLDDFRDDLAEAARELIASRLKELPASHGAFSFEAVCGDVITASGYEIERRNHYADGGDADFVCRRTSGDASPFGERGRLFVQVKRHAGTTGVHAIEQVIKAADGKDADMCVITLADEFNDAAIKLADDNGVVLIAGLEVCQLVLQRLGDRRPQAAHA